MSAQTKWQIKQSLPFTSEWDHPNLYSMQSGRECNILCISSENGRISKYTDNNWSTIFSYPPTLSQSCAYDTTISTFNENTESIFIVTKPLNIFEINLKSKLCTKIYEEADHDPLQSLSQQTQIVSIDDTIHIFDGSHIQFNVKTNNYIKGGIGVDTKDPIKAIYSKDENCMFLVQSDTDNDKCIMKYSLLISDWQELRAIFPKCYYNNDMPVLFTNDKAYIIMVGCGVNENKIYYFYRKKRTLHRSTVNLPILNEDERGQFMAIITRNKLSEELLVFGYVNKLYTYSEFKNVKKLPQYLIQLFCKWISMEYVHVINSQSGKHYAIDINEIVG